MDVAPDNPRGRLAHIVKVAVPVSVLSALLYYFGYIYTAAQVKYWRIPPTYLRLSTTDYLLRSSTAAYVSLARGAVVALAATIIWRPTRTWLERTWLRRQRFMTAAFVAGAIGVLVGSKTIEQAREGRSVVPAMLLMASGALLAAAFSMTRSDDRFLAMLLAGAIAVAGAFAWVHIYARTAGVNRAAEITAETQGLADLVVYSNEPLPLFRVHDVTLTILDEADSGSPVYRYTCLKLLTRFDDTLLVVPVDFAVDGNARVVYALDANAVRLDFDARAASTGQTIAC